MIEQPDTTTTTTPPPAAPDTLTQRQQQVAILLALGRNHHEIATEIGCGVKTVDTHRASVLSRLKLRNNVELARHALREGWVTL
jgi:DNA-binding NarL/FixJ family response regulator